MKVIQNLWNNQTLKDKEKIKKTQNLTLNGYYKKSKDFINNSFLINEELIEKNNVPLNLNSNSENQIETKEIPNSDLQNDTSKNQNMKEGDKLILTNILSYNQNGKNVKEQEEISKKRLENMKRLIEIQEEEKFNKNIKVEFQEKQKIFSNGFSPITGQGSLNNSDGNKLINQYSKNTFNKNVFKNEKGKSILHGIEVKNETLDQYNKEMKKSKLNNLKYGLKIGSSVGVSDILKTPNGGGLSVSSGMLERFLKHKGNTIYGQNHLYTQKLKQSNEFKKFVGELEKNLKNIKTQKDLDELLESGKFNSIGFSGDLGYSIGNAGMMLSGKINEEGNKEIDVILSDTYDFHFTNTNGERFDNKTFKDIIKKQLNEAGLYFEVNGKGKPFDWDMHLKLIIPK